MPRYYFSQASALRLGTCDKRLQAVLILALNQTYIDFGIACGYRGRAEQEKAFREGSSKVQFPNSAHNSSPSKAVDIFACPRGKISFEHKYYFYLAGLLDACTAEINQRMKNITPFRLTWGGAWLNNGDFNSDGQFMDLMHWEIHELSSKEGEI